MTDQNTTLKNDSPLMVDIVRKKELRRKIIIALSKEEMWEKIEAIELIVIDAQIELLDDQIKKMKLHK